MQTQSQPHTSILCDPAVVATNARGDLTAQQRAALRSRLPGSGDDWIVFAFSVLILGVVLYNWRLAILFFTFKDPFSATKTILGHTFSVSIFHLFGGVIVLSWLLVFLRGVETLLARLRASNALKPGRVASADGTIAWSGSAYAAFLPGRRGALEPWNLGLIEDLMPGPYRVWYIPHGGWLLALQPLAIPYGASEPPGAGETALAPVLARVNGCLPEALAANRAGQLTGEQARGLAMRERTTAWKALALTIGLIAAAPAFWYYGELQSAIVCAGVGILSFVHLLRQPVRSALDKDLAVGRVLVVEGETRKVQQRKRSVAGLLAGGDNLYREGYHYAVQNQRFPVSETAYHALIEGMPCRLYYLPRSGTLVNIETLAPYSLLQKDRVGGGGL